VALTQTHRTRPPSAPADRSTVAKSIVCSATWRRAKQSSLTALRVSSQTRSLDQRSIPQCDGSDAGWTDHSKASRIRQGSVPCLGLGAILDRAQAADVVNAVLSQPRTDCDRYLGAVPAATRLRSRRAASAACDQAAPCIGTRVRDGLSRSPCLPRRAGAGGQPRLTPGPRGRSDADTGGRWPNLLRAGLLGYMPSMPAQPAVKWLWTS
jgi:hypothetical protein